MARKLQSISLGGPAGRLEALLEEPEAPSRIERSVVLCHPHPQHGGTMHNKVVFRMARAARSRGAAVLRFNFRGVGTSSGSYDGGLGEQDDLRAAMQYMRERYAGRALSVGGFSFGSTVSLRVCCGDAGIERVIAVGTPVNRGGTSFLTACGCPKHFVHSTRDEYGSRSNMERVFAMAGPPKQLTWVEASDHFFAGALDGLEDAVRQALG
ncbi:MAG: alpha/beta hydrolase [Bryobacterales bacterium]|nr:alpha/beta hydrolase [Bryobacterales bacterium]